MKNLLGIFIQYYQEIMAFIFSLTYFVITGKLLKTILLWFFIWILVYFVFGLVYKFMRPSYRVLHLRRNKICMKAQFQNRRSIWSDFWSDFNAILKYAKEQNIYTLITDTHLMILSYLLKELGCGEYCKRLHKLPKGEMLSLNSRVGKIEVMYLGRYINNCARYQYSIIMKWSEVKKTFRKLDFYHVTIYLPNDG